ncbi:Capsular polysaccharide synthesis enzyme CpsH [Vibrio chagasii]|nr:Capsular polysaccharide synthesis enzyme CpsH [Vibrio chagasii]CAH6940221.1 Capsular polysaccharide synthesis enzyme CpsH [Vibrio chagasii]
MIKKIKSLLETYRKFKVDPLVLVYQMGKVGSSSVYFSLKNDGENIYHIHSFNGLDIIDMYDDKTTVKRFYSLRKRIEHYIYIKIRLLFIRRNNNLKIITFIRPELSVLKSRYFQDLHFGVYKAYQSHVIFKNKRNFIDFIIDDFERSISDDYVSGWFDREIKRNFGIDVMKTYYDSSVGFSITKGVNGRQCMLINMEHLDHLENEIGEFLNKPGFKLVRENDSSEKWYSEFYSIFNDEYKPSKEFKDRVDSSDYNRKFYG